MSVRAQINRYFRLKNRDEQEVIVSTRQALQRKVVELESRNTDGARAKTQRTVDRLRAKLEELEGQAKQRRVAQLEKELEASLDISLADEATTQ